MNDSDFEIISDKLINKPSPIFSIREAKIKIPTGVIIRQYVDHQDSVAMFVTHWNNEKDYLEILATNQFRIGVKGVTLGIPAGLIEPNETPEEAVVRELREETGIILNKANIRDLHAISTINSSEGFTNEKVHIFSIEISDKEKENAQGQDLDSDEYVKSHWVDYNSFCEDLYKQDSVSAPLEVAINMYELINNYVSREDY